MVFVISVVIKSLAAFQQKHADSEVQWKDRTASLDQTICFLKSEIARLEVALSICLDSWIQAESSAQQAAVRPRAQTTHAETQATDGFDMSDMQKRLEVLQYQKAQAIGEGLGLKEELRHMKREMAQRDVCYVMVMCCDLQHELAGFRGELDKLSQESRSMLQREMARAALPCSSCLAMRGLS
jgi:hypothetical protein